MNSNQYGWLLKILLGPGEKNLGPSSGYSQNSLSRLTVEQEQKKKLRKEYIEKRCSLTPETRMQKSGRILEILYNLPVYTNSRAVMTYVTLGAEVDTTDIITRLLSDPTRRAILPFSRPGEYGLGISSIKNLEQDTVIGKRKTREPKSGLLNNFLLSDISLVICPGVAFDRHGGRLGRGNSHFDRFVKGMKGKVPLVGLAYSCQIVPEKIPFEPHDVPMDYIITEDEVLLSPSI